MHSGVTTLVTETEIVKSTMQGRFFCVLILVFVAGCNRRSVTAGELSSALREIISTSAEAELLIDKVQRGQVTPTFARSHNAYLLEETKQSAREMADAPTTGNLRPVLESCRRDQQLLDTALQRIDSTLENLPGLIAVKEQVRAIRTAAANTRAAL